MTRFQRIFVKSLPYVSLGFIALAMGFLACYLYFAPRLPNIEELKDVRYETPMSIYTKDGLFIAEKGLKRRIPITLDQVPQAFINALLATEDQRFYSHSGVDFIGIGRAFINLITTGSKSQGASTITMLVSRNFYLTRTQTFSRKLTEIFLSWKIESELSKNQILELLLNKIPFGHNTHGLGAAAKLYYGTTLDQLTLPQLAMLAGIPKAQSTLNPISNPERAIVRRNHVLKRMLVEDYIDQQTYDEAITTPLTGKSHAAEAQVYAPYVAEMVRQEMIRRFGQYKAYSSGFKVYTTLDGNLQAAARQAVRQGLIEYDLRHGYRGAEQKFAGFDPSDKIAAIELLKPIPEIASLQPALIVDVQEQSAIALLKNGESIVLDWPGMQWARKYINQDRKGPKLKQAADILAVGDMIRVLPPEDPEATSSWQLSQIPDVNAALVSLNPNDGAIVALVGGLDWALSKFNRVVQAKRQPGSNIKPFIYSAAFEKGYTPASIVNDSPITMYDVAGEEIYRPKNDGNKYYGPIRLRKALPKSLNTVSLRIVEAITPEFVVDYLTRFGFNKRDLPAVLSIALGSPSVRPLDVVTGYATFANTGFKIEPYFIARIEDEDGNIVQEHDPLIACNPCEELEEKTDNAISLAPQVDTVANELDIFADEESVTEDPEQPLPPNYAERVIEPRNVYLVNTLMEDVIHRGTATRFLNRVNSPLLKRQDIAGKTGTANDAKDLWFSGYTPYYATSVWVGFDDHNKSLGKREFGSTAALPIWHSFMQEALKDKPNKPYQQPPGIVRVRINLEDGLLAKSSDPNSAFEWFRIENQPTQYSEHSKTVSPFDNHEENKDKPKDSNSIF